MSGSGKAILRILRNCAVVGAVVALPALAAAASSTAGTSHADVLRVTPVGSRSGKVSIQVSLNATGHGKFTARGLVADAGVALGEPRVSPKKVRLKITFAGVGGPFRVVVVQLCGRSLSTWAVTTGGKAYRGLTGHGVGHGRIPCGRGPVRLSLTGVAKRPVLPLALPGTYRGTRASENLRVSFDVLATGAAVTNASFAQLVARCAGSRTVFLKPRFTGNYRIGSDKRFSIAENGYTVTGTFSTQSAQGTIAYDNGGCQMDRIAWTATTPPPPLPSVPRGRYCGFTLQGVGICVDATPDGWVANARTGVNVRCISPEKTTLNASYQFGGQIVIGSDRSFHLQLAQVPLDDGGSITWKLSGKFDGTGGAAGTVSFSSVVLSHNGTLYTCRGAASTWTAQLGR